MGKEIIDYFWIKTILNMSSANQTSNTLIETFVNTFIDNQMGKFEPLHQEAINKAIEVFTTHLMDVVINHVIDKNVEFKSDTSRAMTYGPSPCIFIPEFNVIINKLLEMPDGPMVGTFGLVVRKIQYHIMITFSEWWKNKAKTELTPIIRKALMDNVFGREGLESMINTFDYTSAYKDVITHQAMLLRNDMKSMLSSYDMQDDEVYDDNMQNNVNDSEPNDDNEEYDQ